MFQSIFVRMTNKAIALTIDLYSREGKRAKRPKLCVHILKVSVSNECCKGKQNR